MSCNPCIIARPASLCILGKGLQRWNNRTAFTLAGIHHHLLGRLLPFNSLIIFNPVFCDCNFQPMQHAAAAASVGEKAKHKHCIAQSLSGGTAIMPGVSPLKASLLSQKGWLPDGYLTEKPQGLVLFGDTFSFTTCDFLSHENHWIISSRSDSFFCEDSHLFVRRRNKYLKLDGINPSLWYSYGSWAKTRVIFMGFTCYTAFLPYRTLHDAFKWRIQAFVDFKGWPLIKGCEGKALLTRILGYTYWWPCVGSWHCGI